jgi:DNA-binding GntR family transcriptional regulator
MRGIPGLRPSSRARTAHQYAHDTLREAILSGELPAGSRLVQADIAGQLRVSTTPVREALRDLATEGLVHFDPHRGAIVRELDWEEVREIYQLRQLLEPLAIRLAVGRMSDEELRAANRLAQEMESESSPGRWVELNRASHGLFADSARSPRLQSILAGLRDGAAVYVALTLRYQPSGMARGNLEHRALLDAFERRDADRAASIELRHLETTLATIETWHRDVLQAAEPPADG